MLVIWINTLFCHIISSVRASIKAWLHDAVYTNLVTFKQGLGSNLPKILVNISFLYSRLRVKGRQRLGLHFL